MLKTLTVTLPDLAPKLVEPAKKEVGFKDLVTGFILMWGRRRKTSENENGRETPRQ